MIDYLKVKKIIGVGIGGEGMFYLAKFFNLLGSEISGFDISENKRVQELKKLGIDVKIGNPTESFPQDTDMYLYTNALPDKLKQQLKEQNPNTDSVEVGELNEQLIEDYESGKMSDEVKSAFEESEIAPLYKLDYSKMKYIGITGTDGKTTTATMIYHILKVQGYKVALISTVSAKIGNEEIDTGFHVTSPAPWDLYKLLLKVEDEKCTHVIIEATSHGLSMGRLAGVKFDIAVYTNITNEHLDYHGTWENLFEAKSKLITRHLKRGGFAILNRDDKSFDGLSKLTNKFMMYSQTDIQNERKAAWVMSRELVGGLSFNFGLNFENKSFRNIKVDLNLLGDYNISNALAAISTCYVLGLQPEQSAKSLASFKAVMGRMQILQEKPFRVIVDFAHTPNALENALKSVKKNTSGKLIVVFGCAGQRDKHKRFEMGKIAGQLADITIITAEDPRTEKLSEINDEIYRGWTEAGARKDVYRFDDDSLLVNIRRNAIKKAIELAYPGDTIIITGKGHEKSLCFGTVEYPWNDIEETKKLLEWNLKKN